jgi:hypothetical protein
MTSRSHGTIGLDIDDELVEVRHLPDLGAFDPVGHVANRREDRVDRDDADGVAGLVALGAAIADTAGGGHLDLELARGGHRCKVQVAVDDIDAGRSLDVGRRDVLLALRRDVQRLGVLALDAEDHLLEVQDEVDDVFDDTVHRGELVLHAVDADGRDRGTWDARQQRATQRIAERVTESGLERLNDEPGADV